MLRPAILWNDQRTGAECDVIRARMGKARLIQVTGNDALTGFTAPKILWVREHEPDIYARVRARAAAQGLRPLQTHRGLRHRQSRRAGTLLFDIKARDWSPEVLEKLEIPAEWMPPTFEGPEVTGVISGRRRR